MSNTQLSTIRSVPLGRFSELASSARSHKALSKASPNGLSRELPHCGRAGFYMLELKDSEILVPGPFVSDPTPHIRIPATEGICGTAVAKGETVVDDVNFRSRYLLLKEATRVLGGYAEQHTDWGRSAN